MYVELLTILLDSICFWNMNIVCSLGQYYKHRFFIGVSEIQTFLAQKIVLNFNLQILPDVNISGFTLQFVFTEKW